MKKLYVLMLLMAGLCQNSLAQNLLDMQNWKIGTGEAGAFALNGTAAENQRIWGIGPYGERAVLWRAKPDGDSMADGGFNHDYFAIDHTSTYRFMIWLKKTNSSNGVSYLGTNNVNNLDGTANVNPYFWNGDLPELNKWYLIVGYVHGSGDNSTTSYGGIYDSVSGKKVATIADYKFDVSTTHANIRSYLYYDPDLNDEQYFYAPKVEKVNGNEQPISSILNNEPIQTMTRNNAGLRGDAGAISGFFETSSPVNYPSSATSWWHLLDVRHSNTINNYAMQFSGSFFDQDLYFRKTNDNATQAWSKVLLEIDGKVGIGTATPNEKLAVNGKIRAKEIKVEPNPATWPDYVFEAGYQVGTLEELERYIKTNKHLPEMPTAKEVAINGVELGEMNRLLLKKVEELTLLLIDQGKKNEKQDETINKLEKELNEIKKIR